MSSFDQFLTEWLTNPPKRVADPLLAGDHPFQCVSFVKQGLAEIDGLNMSNSWWGNALDYWTKTNPAILTKRDRLETQDIVRGDIVILKTAGHTDYVGEGHIGWVTGATNMTQFELVEQNGQTGSGDGIGGDMIRTRWINKSRIAGLLRQKPVVSAPPSIPYTIALTDPKQMKVAPAHNKWNLRYQTFEQIRDNAIGTSDGNTVFTARAILIHRNGYSYYLEDPNVPEGWNTLDCADYVPPVPIVPYIPPTAPVPVTKAETYDLVTTVPYFATASDAFHNKASLGSLPATSYYVFSKDIGMLNLTSNNQKDLQHWVNPAQNVEPSKEPPKPVDEDWQKTYGNFSTTGKPVKYVLLKDYVAEDYGGSGEPRLIKTYTEIPIYGTFTYKTGMVYGRLKLANDTYWRHYYGIPLKRMDGSDPGIVELEQTIYSPATDVITRQATKQLTFRDYGILGLDKAERLVKSIEGVFRPRKGK